MIMKHSDCKNFTPLDAFKGLCPGKWRHGND